jgi:hypothetical protein
MVAQAPFAGQPPPDLPHMPDASPAMTSYLRNFALWAKNGLSGKLDVNTSAPAHLLQGHDAAPRTIPNVFKFQVSQDGVASLAPVALGSGPAASSTPVPIFPEAPSDGGSYGRTDAGWAAVLPLTGGNLSGALILHGPPGAPLEATTKAYVDGAISSSVAAGVAPYLPLAGGTLTGALAAVTLTLTGLLTGVAATLTGLLSLGAGLTFTTLPVNALNDAAAATAGVPVGGVYRNGSTLMVRTI